MITVITENGNIERTLTETNDPPAEPVCILENNVYYVKIDGEPVVGASATVNQFGMQLTPQIVYQDDGIKIRFVNVNGRPKPVNFTLVMGFNADNNFVDDSRQLGEVFHVRV